MWDRRKIKRLREEKKIGRKEKTRERNQYRVNEEKNRIRKKEKWRATGSKF